MRAQWPVRVDERTTEKPERWVQSCCVLCSNGCGLDIGVEGRADRRRPRAGRRPGEPRPARAQGAARLAGERQPRPADRPLVRRDGRLRGGDLGRGDGPGRRAVQETIEQYTAGRDRLLQHRPAVPRGVLHPLASSPRRASAPPISTATPASAPPPPPQALRETFGSDGQPGSYADIDVTDACSWSATTWPRPRPCSGRASSTGWPARTRRSWSSSTPAGRRGRQRPTSTSPRGSGPTSPCSTACCTC